MDETNERSNLKPSKNDNKKSGSCGNADKRVLLVCHTKKAVRAYFGLSYKMPVKQKKK